MWPTLHCLYIMRGILFFKSLFCFTYLVLNKLSSINNVSMKDVGVSIRSCGQNIIWKVLCTSSNASVLRISSKKLSKVQFCEKKMKEKKKKWKLANFFSRTAQLLMIKNNLLLFPQEKKVEKISNWPSNRTIIACTNCSYIPLVKELYVERKYIQLF